MAEGSAYQHRTEIYECPFCGPFLLQRGNKTEAKWASVTPTAFGRLLRTQRSRLGTEEHINHPCLTLICLICYLGCNVKPRSVQQNRTEQQENICITLHRRTYSASAQYQSAQPQLLQYSSIHHPEPTGPGGLRGPHCWRMEEQRKKLEKCSCKLHWRSVQILYSLWSLIPDHHEHIQYSTSALSWAEGHQNHMYVSPGVSP